MTAPRKPWDHGKSTTERGYGWQWQKLRKRILERDRYLCQPCREAGRVRAASQVDHKLAKAKGGTDDPDNLRAICADCHLTKSAADRGQTYRPKRTFSADGWPVE